MHKLRPSEVEREAKAKLSWKLIFLSILW